MVQSWIKLLAVGFLLLTPAGSVAQDSASPPAAPSQQLLKPEELDALVAPIALYPDTLLALVFMASTYPLEVVQADRWTKQNSGLKGDQLKAAVDKQSWDESVRSLVATPSVLEMMSTKLDWTQRLGDAVLAQQADVMDAVQRLRSRAQANKQLSSNKQQTVSVSTAKSSQGQPRQVISIEPTEPSTIYVPHYNPSVVYGGWPYPAYPPYYFPPPGYLAAGVLATGLAFGAGYALGRWASGGNYWGGGMSWNSNNININRPTNINNIGNNWQHRPEHRHGVRYNNPAVQQKFGGNRPSGSAARSDFRGHSGKQGLQPKAGQQPKAGMGPQAKGGMGPQAKGGMGPQGAGGMGPQAKGGMGGMGPQGAGGMGLPAMAGMGPVPSARPGGPPGGSAFGNVGPGRAAGGHSARGHASFGGGAGGRGGGGRGGGRRSDIVLKHDITLLGHLDNGLGFYRFAYRGTETRYVGVMAQEVQLVMPEAVVRGHDGYLRVFYNKLGLRFQTYDQWIASGAEVPSGAFGITTDVARD